MKSMEIINFPKNTNKCLLALGPESDGNFSVYFKGKFYFSRVFGDLLKDENYREFENNLREFLKTNKIKPNVILTDFHPLYKTTSLGKDLGKKFKVKHIKIQHHAAHIFSTIGEKLTKTADYKLQPTSYGIVCDGTGYGLDGKIWGGEVFKIKSEKEKVKSIQRIGHLENQTMIGGDLAIREPARMLIGILSKFLDKEKIYPYLKKYYSCNQFELLYNQLKNNFNCQETSSTGRILDAVSLLLGFSGNERKFKHSPAIALEKNSTRPYAVKPRVIHDRKEKKYVLKTTPLFEYLIKNIRKDKHRLAAAAQLYVAKGLYEIIERCHPKLDSESKIFFAGGISNNKIISSYLERKGAYARKKNHPAKSERSEFNDIPRGDAGLSFGQIVYYLLTDPRD